MFLLPLRPPLRGFENSITLHHTSRGGGETSLSLSVSPRFFSPDWISNFVDFDVDGEIRENRLIAGRRGKKILEIWESGGGRRDRPEIGQHFVPTALLAFQFKRLKLELARKRK